MISDEEDRSRLTAHQIIDEEEAGMARQMKAELEDRTVSRTPCPRCGSSKLLSVQVGGLDGIWAAFCGSCGYGREMVIAEAERRIREKIRQGRQCYGERSTCRYTLCSCRFWCDLAEKAAILAGRFTGRCRA